MMLGYVDVEVEKEHTESVQYHGEATIAVPNGRGE